jgi:hypothetical protein
VNPAKSLSKLNRITKKRVAKLRSFVSPLSLPATPEKDRIMSWAVIEALNLWASFLRAYYLSGVIRTRTRSGHRISFTAVTLPTAQSALRFAVTLLKDKGFKKPNVTRRDEPSWHSVRNFLRLAKVVGVSNLPQIYASFSTGTNFFDLLPTVRHFYAHRCDGTHSEAAKVGIRLGLSTKPVLRATEIMCARLPKRSQNVITDWLDDMENIVDLLC